MDPPGEDLRSSTIEEELASDFLEQEAVSETTDLRDSKHDELKKKSEAKSKQDVDIANLKPTKFQEFSVHRPDDTDIVYFRSLLTLDDKIIIAEGTKKIKLFDRSGKYLSSTDMEQCPYGITRVGKDTFPTSGSQESRDIKIIWTLCGKTITHKETYHVDYALTHGIHFNITYFCVLYYIRSTVAILDRQGRQVRKIVMKEAFGKNIEFGFDVHMDHETHNIYVPCVGDHTGVLCMSVEGESLWFTPLSDVSLFGITEIHGALCIADGRTDKECLHLISKTGQCIGKLLEKKELMGNPRYIHYDENDYKLYIIYSEYSKPDIISVYSLK